MSQNTGILKDWILVSYLCQQGPCGDFVLFSYPFWSYWEGYESSFLPLTRLSKAKHKFCLLQPILMRFPYSSLFAKEWVLKKKKKDAVNRWHLVERELYLEAYHVGLMFQICQLEAVQLWACNFYAIVPWIKKRKKKLVRMSRFYLSLSLLICKLQ